MCFLVILGLWCDLWCGLIGVRGMVCRMTWIKEENYYE